MYDVGQGDIRWCRSARPWSPVQYGHSMHEDLMYLVALKGDNALFRDT